MSDEILSCQKIGNKNRILYLSADRGIPIRGHKGAAVHIRSMIAAFARLGNQVTIASPNPGPEDGPAPDGKLLHIPLPRYCGPDESAELIRDRQSQDYNNVIVSALAPHVKGGHFNLIFERYSLWSDAGAQLAQDTNRPFVLEVNAPLLEEAARYRSLTNPELAAKIEATQFQTADLITVVSESLRDYVIARGGRAGRVLILPNGVDPQFFNPGVRGGEIHSRHRLHNKIVIGFVGRARPWHDLPTLLEAVAQLRLENKRYHLLLVGQMPEKITALLQQFRLEKVATLTGPVPHDEVPEHIAACDVAVSSHGPAENFYFSPLKLFEYLACGVPTVAANVGQPAAIIQEGVTGYLYEPGDPESLADRIRVYINDQTQARTIGWQGAVSVLERYTWRGNATAVLSAIGQAPTSKAKKSAVVQPILDHRLRQRLYRATHPKLASSLLDKRLPSKFGRNLTVKKIKILKYKSGRRCVLYYHLKGTDKKTGQPISRQVIGKVFRDERGQWLHKLHKMLRKNGFGPRNGGKIGIPDSIGYVSKMRMQVQEAVPGQTLNELVTRASLMPYLDQTAEALARLHDLHVPESGWEPDLPIKQYLLSNELANLKRFTADILTARPEASVDVLTPPRRPVRLGKEAATSRQTSSGTP